MCCQAKQVHYKHKDPSPGDYEVVAPFIASNSNIITAKVRHNEYIAPCIRRMLAIILSPL